MSKIESRLAIPARYTRSIHILRDFASDHVGVRDYQATPLVLQTIERVMNGVQANATARAFSLIGPYGSGKSAFGVFLAHYLQSAPSLRHQLVAEHSTEGTPSELLFDGPRLLPVLVSGNNTSLRQAVLRGLYQTLEAQPELRDGRLRVPRIISTAAEQGEIDPQRVADLFSEAVTLVAERTEWDGVVLIVDELGQFLNYAARQADERDLFVLQTLAEMAARSGSAPCVVMTILHQAFDRYATTAGAAQRTEWAKVQGRFIDLPFQEPPIQMLRMVGRALCSEGDDQFVEMRERWADENVEVAERLGLRPSDVSDNEWHTLIARAYPLHPTVLVALPLLFRQLAQNERSLFAFLTSPEPWSVQEFLQSAQVGSTEDDLPIYRLTHLYAYVHTTLGASLFSRARGQRWAELAEALAQLPAREGVLPDVLATIGTLGAMGQTRGLRASRGQIVFALQGLYGEADVERALNELEARKHITYRQHRGSFVIWEGSDLDLDEMTQTARRDIGDRVALVKLLQQYANTTPIVARRHSYQTGAVRYFAVRFVDPAELVATLPIPGNADGDVLYVVPADDEMLLAAQAWAEHSDRAEDTQRIVVLPQRVRELRDLLLDVAALQQVLYTQPELDNDRAARRELSSRLVEAQQMLTETITDTYGAGLSRWYWRGAVKDVRSARQVDELLSYACDQTYHAAPRIWNELIIRRQLSTAASKARRNLIEVMLDHAHENALGLTGYPAERAIYESVFRSSGIHRQDADGAWRFGAPPESDPLKLSTVWQTIQQFLESTEGQAQPIEDLYKQLEAAPFGVKAGVIPLLFIAAYMANAGEVALYEHGNFVPVPDIATFERLLRQPHYFAVRRSRATGVRMAIYERLARALAPRALTRDVQPAVLDAVTPLLRLATTLPQYTRTTKHISEQAQAIRQALLDARAPDELLFEKLPQACGLPAFDPDQQVQDLLIEPFFATLRAGLQELQEAYTHLVSRVRERIRSAFGASAAESSALRIELTQRYRSIATITSDSSIRALGVRLENADAGDGWIESVAALVSRKPLDTWSDGDFVNFNSHIAELGRQFRIAEQIAVTTQALPPDTSILRVGIANGHGELSTVVHFTDRHPLMDQLLTELGDVLARYATLTTEQKTAVLAELLQPNLAESANGNGHYE